MATDGHVQEESLWRTSFGHAGRSASASFLFVFVRYAVQSESWTRTGPWNRVPHNRETKTTVPGPLVWNRMVDNRRRHWGKKRVLPRHVGFNHVPLIKSENWTRLLRFVVRNQTKALVFLLVYPGKINFLLFFFFFFLLE